MKVRRKNIYAQEDCFDAEEKGVHVRISRFRHEIQVAVTRDGKEKYEHLKLSELADLLEPKLSPN